MGGRLPQWLKDLHEVYGPVIRIAPNELSFTEPEAWKDIYSPLANMGKLREFAKYNKFYGFMGPKTADNILNAGFDEHIHLRRQVAPFFSTRNLQQREPLLRRYMDLLMDRLHQECCNGAKPLNLRDWFTFYTFDVIGNLGFGSDFDCLRDSKYHPWVRALTKNLKEYRWIQLLMYLGLDKLVHLITNSAFLRAKIIHENLTKDKLRESLKMERDSNDLLEALVTLDNPALVGGAPTLGAISSADSVTRSRLRNCIATWR
jgi:cytochrome P450